MSQYITIYQDEKILGWARMGTRNSSQLCVKLAAFIALISMNSLGKVIWKAVESL